ncbi:LPS assembly protein LptD [Roseateles asaccharophilus]|uniref:LPS-assembly protein LptD n=1 Tax=Roseateles asaccharophilus TaxID=582607 RepID=A0ABU2AD09_9BURK|nr:LPS assembly protein LptD [Roseateles asaccharophilus]MDR7335092.1 LPS-assembly protein [Roseateles asaccharophilus]
MPRSFRLPRPSLLSALIALGFGAGAPVWAQQAPASDGVALKNSRVLGAPTRTGGKAALAISAGKITAQADQQAEATDAVELRYGEVLLNADQLNYRVVDDFARAEGNVRVHHKGNVFTGPLLQMYVDRFEGEFLTPSFFLAATGGAGKAKVVRFHDSEHLSATAASYSSCPAVENQEPAWQISAKELRLDLAGNEGQAEGAVLRFLGVPLLAAPALSFPLSSARKSGWLPPNIFLDNRSGFEFGVPYYWNIAPQRDATVTPFVMTKRGVGVDSEFRYLEPGHAGRINLDLLPGDRVFGRSRWGLKLDNDGRLGDWRYKLNSERVSDDDYWKDLSRRVESQTPRLLANDFSLHRQRELSWGVIDSYARVQRWQTLQGTDAEAQFVSPYQRSPQVGVRVTTAADEAVLDSFRPWGRKARLEGSLELEYNRFDLPVSALPRQARGGQRVHALGHVAAPLGGEAWWFIPRLSVNAAAYDLDRPLDDGRRRLSRVIPSLSIDHGWVFERDTKLFGRAMRQSLEPRLLYVNTPYRDQLSLPNFDAAPKDFNFDSIYTDNQFSGVDRVSDQHALSFGATSRWISARQGEEILRVGAVQRVLFRDQRITPDGQPVTQRFSDLLLAAAAHLDERWWAETTLELNPETHRFERSVVRARYSPGAYKTVSVAYRLARAQSEQVEFAWQWPIYGTPVTQRGANSQSCGGAWYSAGRVQYSLRDKRLTDSVAGFEYDAGCWLLRFGLERLSTGRAETNTRFMLQLELVGLSQLGSNALKVLKDNVPGYRRLSADRSASSDFQP